MTPSQSALSALPEEGASIYRRAQDYLLKLDGEIERLDKVLARLQPPVTGRVRVVWWKAGEKRSAANRPALVRWVRQGERWRTSRLGLKSLVQKAPKTGAFFHVKDEIREAVRELSVLLNKRSAVVEAIGHFERGMLTFAEAGEELLRESRVRIDALEDRAAMLPCTWRDGQQVGEGTKETLVADLTDEEAQALFDSL